MKTIIATLIAFSATSAFAHGNLAHQAEEAVSAAMKTVEANIPRETIRNLKSVHAENVGHETFAVTVTFKDQTAVNYVCAENEEVEPVVWACTQQ